jgi:NADH-quinone oxidoreductase subunit C
MGIPIIENQRLDIKKVLEQFLGKVLKVKESFGDTHLCIKRESLPEIMQFLKEDPELEYTYFSECLGVDYSKWNHDRDFEERFEVIYNLKSLKHCSRLFVKVGVDEGQKVPSLIHIFMGADYPEREITDLYGIVYEGNEQTQRFMMPDDWNGYPLRKEFPLGGEQIEFDQKTKGPAIKDLEKPHAGESFSGRTGTKEISE